MAEPNLAEMVWNDLNRQIDDIKARIDTLEVRTERSETTSGHPTTTTALAPLAGQGAKSGDELFITDPENLGSHALSGAMAFYDPGSDSWVATGGIPIRWTGWHHQSIVLSGAALSIIHDTLQNHAMFSQQVPGLVGDSFTQSFVLNKGIYTFYQQGVTANNRGIIDWYLDGVLQIAGQSWFSGALVYNVIQSFSITVLGNGKHTLLGVNSGAGFISITDMWIVPSAD